MTWPIPRIGPAARSFFVRVSAGLALPAIVCGGALANPDLAGAQQLGVCFSSAPSICWNYQPYTFSYVGPAGAGRDGYTLNWNGAWTGVVPGASAFNLDLEFVMADGSTQFVWGYFSTQIGGVHSGSRYVHVTSGSAVVLARPRGIAQMAPAAGGAYVAVATCGGSSCIAPSATVTPEPASIILLASGLIGMGGAAVRRRRKGEEV